MLLAALLPTDVIDKLEHEMTETSKGVLLPNASRVTRVPGVLTAARYMWHAVQRSG
jgi:hypothetical protein